MTRAGQTLSWRLFDEPGGRDELTDDGVDGDVNWVVVGRRSDVVVSAARAIGDTPMYPHNRSAPHRIPVHIRRTGQ